MKKKGVWLLTDKELELEQKSEAEQAGQGMV